jgi:hypothetical protein
VRKVRSQTKEIVKAIEENERKSVLSRDQKLEGKEESGERPGKEWGKERRREKKEGFVAEKEREVIAIVGRNIGRIQKGNE